ncbi:helix-turn-helix domain-containing protein [Brevibacillus ginsengisoli]|uniref:helix-turn-helix domain-containing protein n=1 Tax=Brevibacillus ginsengisoli TaxID=363854 RepID=UPI003CF94BA4
MTKSSWIPFSIVLLAAAIAFSGFWIGNAMKVQNSLKSGSFLTSASASTTIPTVPVKALLTLDEAAQYLGLSKEQTLSIVRQEQQQLGQAGSYTGVMLSPVRINSDLYFTKSNLDNWANEVTSQGKSY